MERIRQLIYDELAGLLSEYYIDFDEESFYENYASFVKGVIDNNHLEENDDIEDVVRDMIIGDVLTLLRNISE